jgi:outer membrane protein assembly factor BamA
LALAGSASCSQLPSGRYAVDAVELDGTSRISASEIQERIATAPSPKFLGLFRGVVFDYELFDRYVLERDLARIERFYRARGYYEAKARAGRVEASGNGHVRVTVVVDEGPPVMVGDVRLEGLTALPIDDAAAVLAQVRRRPRKGRPFDEEDYEKAQTRIVAALTDRGYAFASVKGGVEVDLIRHVADIEFKLTPGETAKLGPVTISGIGGIPEPPVRRALDLIEGEPYSTSRLEAARRAVLALGVFADVEIAPILDNKASRVIPISVSVSPSDLRAVKLGGGFELDAVRADLHLAAGWEDRNFLGGLRRLTIEERPGVVLYPTTVPQFQKPTNLLFENRARLELRQPGLFEARTSGTIRGEFSMYPVLFGGTPPATGAIQGYREVNVGVGLDRTFGPLYVSAFYNVQTGFPFRYDSAPECSAVIAGAAADDSCAGQKNVVVTYYSVRTTLDFRDDALHPHSGLFVGNDLQIAGYPAFGGGAGTLVARDFRVQPEVRGYVPISRHWTLALRASAGFVLPQNYGAQFDDPARSPDDLQLVYFRGFFSGGPNSNRGYSYRGVGPRDIVPFFVPNIASAQEACRRDASLPDCDRFPTGGLSLWEAALEVRFPLLGALGGATFCDASDVSRRRFGFARLNPHLSCGAGLHYDTPVGPVRLDVGYQIPHLQVQPETDPSEQPVGAPYAISIGIGEAF